MNTGTQFQSDIEITEDSKESAVRVDSLVKTYPGGVLALNGLTFDVPKGAVFALLGPNGAGKSTTIKVLNTLSRPDSGSALVAGINVLASPQQVRRRIGCVAQKSGCDLHATGRENLILQGKIYGLHGGRHLKIRVDGLLERFHLSGAADAMVRTYSGGMQRKLDIAMGIIHSPEVLFLDEPTTGLDPEARVALWEEVERLVTVDHITVLLTTHYLEEADRLAERVAIVDQGKVVVEGTPAQLKGTLCGDIIEATLMFPVREEDIRHSLRAVSTIGDIVVEKKSLRARTWEGASAVPQILGALEVSGIRVASVNVKRPSLDDVYLHYTGHRYVPTQEEAR